MLVISKEIKVFHVFINLYKSTSISVVLHLHFYFLTLFMYVNEVGDTNNYKLGKCKRGSVNVELQK